MSTSGDEWTVLARKGSKGKLGPLEAWPFWRVTTAQLQRVYVDWRTDLSVVETVNRLTTRVVRTVHPLMLSAYRRLCAVVSRQSAPVPAPIVSWGVHFCRRQTLVMWTKFASPLTVTELACAPVASWNLFGVDHF